MSFYLPQGCQECIYLPTYLSTYQPTYSMDLCSILYVSRISLQDEGVLSSSRHLNVTKSLSCLYVIRSVQRVVIDYRTEDNG